MEGLDRVAILAAAQAQKEICTLMVQAWWRTEQLPCEESPSYSAIRNDEYSPFASTWMELEGIMLSEVSQSEKDKHMVSLIYGEYKK